MNEILVIFLANLVFTQCNDYNQFQCNNDVNCEWIEDITYGSCSALSVSECYNYPGECYVDSNPGWYDSSGPYCTGGTYQINNSYCQELPSAECSEYQTESNCNHIEECEWNEEIVITDCENFDSNIACETEEECTWMVDVEEESCSPLGEASCNAQEGCYWDCSWWYSWACWCLGGTYEVDESWCYGEYESDVGVCEESQYQSGDMNFDSIVNIQDIIAIINTILNNAYNPNGDMNNDSILNVLDIIALVNIILQG